MWNEKTKQLVADGKLVVVGVVQEQHAERARLYKQWKQYKFPIAQDSVTSLGLAVVPVPILIDEFGYVISSRPRISQLDALVAQKSNAPAKPAPTLNPEHVTSQWLKANVSEDSAASASVIGDALLREGTIESINQAIACYSDSNKAANDQQNQKLQGLAMFRLGVAYRSLFDLVKEREQEPSDFTNAAKYWTLALAVNPNQYIWRRRIQQYGPRQIKPYPFYDWVDKANQEIAARGETPVKLTVPLSGAEIAQPNKRFETVTATESNPDPDAKIEHDNESLIKFQATVVPQRVAPGKTVRVHLRFAPDIGHWNNEAEEMLVWINDSQSGTESSSRLVHPNVKEPTSDETRTLEFEFMTNDDVTGKVELEGYALYYVCTSDDGQCLFRRRNFSIPIEIESPQ